MITPSFSPTATERVLPKLALDFTTASLDSRVTFTRTTGASNPATYVNSSGYVTSATNNQPRFDYDPVALTCKGLLIEESRANNILQSQDFSTSWTATSTITTNTTVSPSNVQDADTLNSTVADQIVQQVPTVANDALARTFSVYLKQGTAAKTSLRIIYFGGTNVDVSVTLTWATKTITNDFSSSITYGLIDCGNGWYRIYVTVTNNNSGNTSLTCRILPAGANFVGGTTGTIFAWGAQLEVGAFATSYIPTTTTALTRNADVATMTGTNFSSWFNQTQGAFYAEGYGGTVRGCFAAIDDDTMNNRYQMNISAVGPYSPNFAAVSGGVVSADLYMSAVTQSANIKQVGAYKLDSFSLSAFGATPQTDTSGVLPVSVSMLRFGRLQNGNNPLNGCLKKFYYWPQRLTDAEVQAFSK